MYNHRKLKSSFFLRDDLYPERVLSKHKHYKKSGVYAIFKSQLLSPSSADVGTLEIAKSSKMLLQGIPQLYSDNLIVQASSGNTAVDQRGLQEMGGLSFTNGLLESGHRYFRIK